MELKVFENNDFGQVRVVNQDGEPWFVATDVCKVLEIQNTSQALQRLDEDERSMLNIGRQGEANVVNEYGLYTLILGSRKESAKQFKRWITHEVIPSIRKTGQYSVDQSSYVIEDPIKRAERWIEEQKERLMLQQQVLEYKPKVDYVDKILKAKGAVNIGQIAGDYGLSAYALNQILHTERVQYKLGSQWLLYSEHRDKGYTKSDTHMYVKDDGSEAVSMHTKWTQKGRLFIHDLLTKRGILPIIEREVKK
jgi:anti-repressor protein